MANATIGLFLYSGAGRSTAGRMVCDEAPGHLVVIHQEVDRCDSADDEHRTADDPEQGRHLLPPPPKVDARPRRQEEDEERDDGASCVVGVHVLVALWVRQSGGQDSGDGDEALRLRGRRASGFAVTTPALPDEVACAGEALAAFRAARGAPVRR